MTRPVHDEHPVDVLVAQRVEHDERDKAIVRLQGQVMRGLGAGSGTYLALEKLMSEQSTEREKAYFDVGYEYGLGEGLVRARRGDSTLSEAADAFGRELRQAIVERDLPPLHMLQVLLECAWLVAREEPAR